MSDQSGGRGRGGTFGPGRQGMEGTSPPPHFKIHLPPPLVDKKERESCLHPRGQYAKWATSSERRNGDAHSLKGIHINNSSAFMPPLCKHLGRKLFFSTPEEAKLPGLL